MERPLCIRATRTAHHEASPRVAFSTSFKRLPLYLQSDFIGCSSNLKQPHWQN